MSTVRRVELKRKIENLLKENRLIEDAVEALEKEIQHYASAESEIEDARPAMKQKYQQAYESGNQFKLVKSLLAKMNEALDGPEFSKLWNDIFAAADKLRTSKRRLLDQLDENEYKIAALNSELNSLPMEVQDGD